MIEHLDGIYETVQFREHPGIQISRLFRKEDFPPHWHTQVEMIRCKENGYTIVAGEQTFRLQEGDIAFIRPGTIHELFAPENGVRFIYLVDVEPLRHLGNLETLISLFSPVTVVSMEQNGKLYEKIREILEELEREYQKDDAFQRLSIDSLLLRLFVSLGRGLQEFSLPENGALPSRYGERLLLVCRYIHEHCTEPISLDQAAALAGFSKFHFTRIFRAYMNSTFSAYLGRKRIAYAETLLSNPEFSITEVAFRSGFSSPSAFVRAFRQIKGCTPTAFRGLYASWELYAPGQPEADSEKKRIG